MMIRLNLLVLGLVMFSVTGCSALTLHQFHTGPKNMGLHKPSHQRGCRHAKCKCHERHGKKHPGSLYPGDMNGQFGPMYGPAAQPWMSGSCDYGMAGGCDTGGCSDCGGSMDYGQSMSGSGCSSCGGDMMAMGSPMQMGSPMGAPMSQGCGCGQDHSSYMPGQGYSPQTMPSMPGHMEQYGNPPEGAPLPPAEHFQAPKGGASERDLPPVPNDAAPPAQTPVDPVSWQIPTASHPATRLPYPAQPHMTRRVTQASATSR